MSIDLTIKDIQTYDESEIGESYKETVVADNATTLTFIKKFDINSQTLYDENLKKIDNKYLTINDDALSIIISAEYPDLVDGKQFSIISIRQFDTTVDNIKSSSINLLDIKTDLNYTDYQPSIGTSENTFDSAYFDVIEVDGIDVSETLVTHSDDISDLQEDSINLSFVDSDIIPDTNISYNIGSTDFKWNNIYTNNINTSSFNSDYGISIKSDIYYTFEIEIDPNYYYFKMNDKSNGNRTAIQTYDDFYLTSSTGFNQIFSREGTNIRTQYTNVGLSLQNVDGSTEYGKFTEDGNQLFNFTKIGDLAPAIKTKILTGTTGVAEGDDVTVEHNLTGSQILSATLKVDYDTDKGVFAEHIASPGKQVSFRHTTTSFIVSNNDTNSEDVLEKPFTILITYQA